MKAMRRDEKGFTLIELMIVIIILGVLAVIGIPKLMNSKQQAWAGVCLTNRSSLEDAAERYQFDTDAYPTGTSTESNGGQALLLLAKTDADAPSGYNGPYIKRMYYCPASTSADTYTIKSDGQVTCSKIAEDDDDVGSGEHASK
jgi:general secretion pathway protein G